MVTWVVFASSWNKVSNYLWASVCSLAQQCWKVPATSEANAKLECWVYQCLLEAYQLQPATVMPVAQILEPGNGAAARPALSSQTMEACAAKAKFLLCLLKKPVYPHPSTTASWYCDNPGSDTFFLSSFLWGSRSTLFILLKVFAISIHCSSK